MGSCVIVVCQIPDVFRIPMNMFNSSQHWLNQLPCDLSAGRWLELGSGDALDTVELAKEAASIICSDLIRDRWQHCAANFPDIPFVQLDHQVGLPFRPAVFDGVLAGLSLHYFCRADSFGVLREIRRVLKPGGVLIARVNSSLDIRHGAGVGEQIEPGYYHAAGSSHARFKRFFTEADVRDLLQQWELQHLVESRFDYYGNEKVAWEFVAR